ncbi:MAG: SDR family NAD(P)-dependent oxidoreductase [Longimicrobiales bacterium]
MKLTGRVALVTGGARRIGRALTLALARAGADVAINHHGSEQEAERTAADVRELGRRALVVRADLAQVAEARRLVDTAAQALGRLDILVNSAARFDSGSIEDIDEAAWDRVMAVNLRAPFFLSQAAVPHMKEAGVIINIADLAAFQSWTHYAHHAAAKAGLVHLTRVLARALAPAIRVNCIAPGTVLPPPGTSAQEVARLAKRAALGRIGSPDDVARALLYLIEADYVTGHVLVLDGGRLLNC